MRCAKELRIRYVRTKLRVPDDIIKIPRQIYDIFSPILKHCDKEKLISVHLNSRHQINCYETLSIGSSTSCLISPREIFKGVLLSNSVAFVLIHNHPSGDCAFSSTDIEVAKKISEASETVGITMFDFIVIGDTGFSSYQQLDIFKNTSKNKGVNIILRLIEDVKTYLKN